MRDLLRARDNARSGPLAEPVEAKLEQLWKHGGRKGDMTSGLQPDSIIVRPRFLVLPTDDPHGPGLPMRNVRRVPPLPDEDYLS